MENYIMGGIGGIDNFIHETCVITNPELMTLGNHCLIDGFLWCTAELELADHVHIGSHVSITGGNNAIFKMGNFSSLGSGCRVICCSEHKDENILAPVIIEDYVSVGANTVIMPGVRLPEGCAILPHSLVQDYNMIRPWVIYGGNPLMAIRERRKDKILNYAKDLGYVIG